MNGSNGRLLSRLARRRLHPRWARAVVGVGERDSRAIGSGIEFAEHRPYEPGDDLRHLDRHAYARFGEAYVKQYAADRGLDVLLVIDVSASMAYGTPPKLEVARSLAYGLSCAVLAGGDRLRLGTLNGTELRLSPALTGLGRLGDATSWASADAGAGTTDLLAAARANRARLSGHGMLIVVSDWWTDAPADAVRALARGGRELVAVHLLAPEEEDLAPDEVDEVRLHDAETGEVLDLALDGAARERYRRGLDAWRDELRDAVGSVHGRYLPVRSDEEPEQVLLRRWRKEGFLA